MERWDKVARVERKRVNGNAVLEWKVGRRRKGMRWDGREGVNCVQKGRISSYYVTIPQ